MTDTITTIGCDGCALGRSAACDDCIVTFLTAAPASAGVVEVVELVARRRARREQVVPTHPYQRRRS